MQALIWFGQIAATEPDVDLIAHNLHAWIAHDSSIPRLIACNGFEIQLSRPVYAVGGFCESDAAMLGAIAAGVEHPIRSAGRPHRGLAQTVFIKRSRVAEFEDRIRAQLCPRAAVLRLRDPEPLPTSAILAEVVHVEFATGLNDVWI